MTQLTRVNSNASKSGQPAANVSVSVSVSGNGNGNSNAIATGQHHHQQQQQDRQENKKRDVVQMKRSLGLWNGIAIIIGVIVGSGIFVSPKGVLEHSGSVGASLIVWCLCGLLALLGALCFAELGTSISASGGEYTYIRLAYGPLPSFLYIWVLVLVIMPCSNAISALTFANYCLQPLYVSLTSTTSTFAATSTGTAAATATATATATTTQMSQLNNQLNQPPEQAIRLVALALIMLLVYVNCASLNGTLRMQGTFTMAKVLALGLIIIYGLYYLLSGNPFKSLEPTSDSSSSSSNSSSSVVQVGPPAAAAAAATNQSSISGDQHHGWLGALSSSSSSSSWSGVWAGTQTSLPELARAFYSGFFTYSGWSALNCVTEEMRSPVRNLPRAIVISITSITLIYILANTAYFAVLTKAEMLNSDAIAVVFGERAFGRGAASHLASWLMPLVVALSTMGGLNASIFSASRVYFAAARQGQLFSVLEMINISSLTPMPALIFLGLTSSLYLVTTEITTLIEYMTFVEASFAALAVSTMLALRHRLPHLERPLRVPVAVPLLYLALTAALLALPLWSAPLNNSIGIAITLTGLPAYYLTARWRRKPRAYQLAIDHLNRVTQKLTLSVVPEKDLETLTNTGNNHDHSSDK